MRLVLDQSVAGPNFGAVRLRPLSFVSRRSRKLSDQSSAAASIAYEAAVDAGDSSLVSAKYSKTFARTVVVGVAFDGRQEAP